MVFGVPLTPFVVINFLVLAFTAWVAMIRYSRETTSNIPLLYWIAIIAHMRFFEGGYEPRWVFAGVACALLLRFEFINPAIQKVLLIAEFIPLGYIVWRTIGLILRW